MRELDFRRFVKGAACMAVIGMGGLAAPTVVVAQTPNDPAATAPQTGVTDDNDTDWGWVGLLGLAGLLGLRRRDNVDTTRRP